MKNTRLDRFVKVQESIYAIAFEEIRHCRKSSHWMWFIFPQIAGLGFSETSRFYAIRDIAEAQEYLDHPILGNRLSEISNELLRHRGIPASTIFGSPDDMKLRSSMTLFASADRTDPVFGQVFDQFFEGKKDEKTIGLLSGRE
jgi:uncharacterized protein (DUF1810 family)